MLGYAHGTCRASATTPDLSPSHHFNPNLKPEINFCSSTAAHTSSSQVLRSFLLPCHPSPFPLHRVQPFNYLGTLRYRTKGRKVARNLTY